VHGKKKFRTRIIHKTLEPVWDQYGEYEGVLGHFLRSPMLLKLYDHDGTLRRDDPLGTCSVDLSPLLESAKISLKGVALTGVAHGTVDVSVTFQQTSTTFAFPGPVAASAASALQDAVMDIPSDATWLEQKRDILLAYLASHPIFHYLTILWVAAVVVWVILLLVIIPMKMGIVPWGGLNWRPHDEQRAWVVINTVLCSLFTWQNLLTFPWRVSLLVHVLPCNPRSADPGLDFYGRPTDAMFFSIGTKHRAAITTLLVLASLLQFVQQGLRAHYRTYETSEEQQPGQALILTSFVGSIVSALIGGTYQFVQLYSLHAELPERFPPSALVTAVAAFLHNVKQGGCGSCNCCRLIKGSLEEYQDMRRRASCRGSVASCRGGSVVSAPPPQEGAAGPAAPSAPAVAPSEAISAAAPAAGEDSALSEPGALERFDTCPELSVGSVLSKLWASSRSMSGLRVVELDLEEASVASSASASASLTSHSSSIRIAVGDAHADKV
jgi:hypothetical protein